MIKAVDYLTRNLRLIAPNEKDWVDSGKIVARIAKVKGFDIHKLREIHFDVLIAMAARRIGAYLITSDANDFNAIRDVMDFNLLCW